MKIKCPQCRNIAEATILFSKRITGGVYFTATYYLVECNSCQGICLSSDPRRLSARSLKDIHPQNILWPPPKSMQLQAFPTLVAAALSDAVDCYNAGVYSACAVMVGKAVEAVCLDKLGKPNNLQEGLQLLRNAKIIDEMLYSWGDLLRKERNIGAHANDQTTSRQDADDILEFAHAICHYIYVLAQKQEEYLRRKLAKKTRRRNK